MSEFIDSENIDKKFMHAVNEQCVLEIKKHIKFTTNVHYKCKITGKTALHVLAKFSAFGGTNIEESNELIKWLVNELNFNINVQDAGNWTPLHMACRFTKTTSHISTVKLLLELNADVNVLTKKNRSPIILAINESKRASCDEVVSLLLDYGVNVNEKQLGMTPLMFACRDSHVECVDDNYNYCCSSITTVELLLKRGANPNIVINNKTPLLLTYEYLGKNTHIDTLKMLIKYGANMHLIINGKSFYQIVSDDIKEQLVPHLIEIDEVIDQKIYLKKNVFYALMNYL